MVHQKLVNKVINTITSVTVVISYFKIEVVKKVRALIQYLYILMHDLIY